jgi:hypothetical protein
MPLTVESPSFRHGEPLPSRFARKSDNTSPPLRWRGEPPGTKSFAVMIEDPDAPDPRAPKRTFCHWIVYDIPKIAHELAENASARGLPRGAEQGENDWGEPAYGGPQPPIGRHRYVFRVFALDTDLPRQSYRRADFLDAIEGHVLDEAQIVGTFDAHG